MSDDKPQGTSAQRLMRMVEAADAVADDPQTVLFQHTVFCQTGLPYRNPGEEARIWERVNGAATLKIIAGEAMHPKLRRFVPIGLPFGPKPRLILAHLNAEALRRQSPEIEVEASLTAFVKRLRLDPGGRTISTIKDQLARLSASAIRLGLVRDGHAITVNSQIITAFDLWFPKDDRQRVLWPTTVRLSGDYFDSLARHAVPLHERALMALSSSAMGLDVYAWLAQRLHRIDRNKPVLVPWPTLQAQFGWHYDRVRDFRRVFRQTVQLVHSQYRAAAIELDGRGITLQHSPPPVNGRTEIVVHKP
ncbi:MAG: replication protein RepA [Acetobacteraceae bacterium]